MAAEYRIPTNAAMIIAIERWRWRRSRLAGGPAAATPPISIPTGLAVGLTQWPRSDLLQQGSFATTATRQSSSTPSSPTTWTVARFWRGAYARTAPAMAPTTMPPINISQPKLAKSTSTPYKISSTNRPMSARTSSLVLYLKIALAASSPSTAAEAP